MHFFFQPRGVYIFLVTFFLNFFSLFLVLSFSHEGEISYSDKLNTLNTGVFKGFPPGLKSMQLEYTDHKNITQCYENFSLEDLSSRNSNFSLDNYSTYLHENKYCSLKDSFEYFAENSVNSEKENSNTEEAGSNEWCVFIINLANLKALKSPELYLQSGIVSNSPLRLRLQFETSSKLLTKYFLHSTWLSTFQINFTGSPNNQSISYNPRSLYI